MISHTSNGVWAITQSGKEQGWSGQQEPLLHLQESPLPPSPRPSSCTTHPCIHPSIHPFIHPCIHPSTHPPSLSTSCASTEYQDTWQITLAALPSRNSILGETTPGKLKLPFSSKKSNQKGSHEQFLSALLN